MDGSARHPVPKEASRASSYLLPTVLLVDDHAAVRELLERQLRDGGYRVIPAASGREALTILTQHAETIDLLLTDILMPEMIGAQLVAIVHRRWPTVHTLYLTGGVEDWAGELMRETGAQCLMKPFTAAQLRSALAGMLSDSAVAED